MENPPSPYEGEGGFLLVGISFLPFVATGAKLLLKPPIVSTAKL